MEITQITLEGRQIPLSIRRHRRARRISLRLSAGRDAIVMTLPTRASVASGLNFVSSKAGWVLNNLETDETIGFAENVVIPILGQEYTIKCIVGRGISEIIGDTLQVHCAEEFVSRRVHDFLKKYLRELCFTRATAMANLIGRHVSGVRVGNTRSRWGSCSPSGTLTFHWQLVFGPPAILDYLIAHEVAHLKEMNHSAKFWKVVAELCPHYASARKWLRSEGHKLHRYGK